MGLQHFTFGPFQENTFILYDDTSRGAAIIDPGCYTPQEEVQLTQFIEQNKLVPQHLLNTHCHLDHVFGNKFIADTYGLKVEACALDLPTLGMVQRSCDLYGIPGYKTSPEPEVFLEQGDYIMIGNLRLDIIFVPGHAPGHIAFINHAEQYVVNGDCLFQGSIGRTDLPGGDYATLETSIKEKLYTLPDTYVVHCGHGPATTIGHEKLHNGFVRA